MLGRFWFGIITKHGGCLLLQFSELGFSRLTFRGTLIRIVCTGSHLARFSSVCVLVDRSTDKPAVRELAEYLEHLRLSYYFDERDETLRRLSEQGHSEPQAIVNDIDEGIAHSTHQLAS